MLFQERVLFLGQEGGSGILFNRVNSPQTLHEGTRVQLETQPGQEIDSQE